MRRKLGFLTTVVGMLALAPAARAQIAELQKGIDAHNSGDYAGSIAAFEAAVAAYPDFVPARLQLGSAYLRRVGLEADFETTMRMAGLAAGQFREALQRDPGNRLALLQTAAAFFYMGNIEDAKGVLRRTIQANGSDTEALLALGYVGLSQATRKQFPAQTVTGTSLPITDSTVRTDLRTKWLAVLDEAQQSLGLAALLNGNDEDALGYLWVLLQRKAELAGTVTEYQALVQQVDTLKQQAIAVTGKGTRAHSASVTLHITLPPPPVPLVAPLLGGVK